MKTVPVRIHGLVLEHKTQQHVVVLREEEGVRILPIWIGPGEAMAIQRRNRRLYSQTSGANRGRCLR